MSVYSQEYSFNIHPSFLNQPSSKAETSCVSEVDHGLGEGEGKTINVSLFPGVPAMKVRERLNQRKHLCLIEFD